MRIAQAVVSSDRGRLVVGRRVGVVEWCRDRIRHPRIEVDVGLHAGGPGAGTRRLRRTGQALAGVEQAQRRVRSAGGDNAIHRHDALELQALGIDDETVLVQLELAVAAEQRAAQTVIHLEEAAAVDGNVQWIVGHRNIALGELLDDGRHPGAETDRRRAGAVQRCRENVGELRRTGLETDRAGIGDVVADGVQRLGRRIQSAQSLLKSHGALPLRKFV